jgi:hypothetical protein
MITVSPFTFSIDKYLRYNNQQVVSTSRLITTVTRPMITTEEMHLLQVVIWISPYTMLPIHFKDRGAARVASLYCEIYNITTATGINLMEDFLTRCNISKEKYHHTHLSDSLNFQNVTLFPFTWSACFDIQVRQLYRYPLEIYQGMHQFAQTSYITAYYFEKIWYLMFAEEIKSDWKRVRNNNISHSSN